MAAGILVLTYGYEQPTNSATGDVWFPAMERNISRMNEHTHDGEDGAQIAPTLQDVQADSWGADLGGGSYRQLIQMPNNFVFDNTRIEVRRSTGEMVYPEIVKSTANKFYLYTNDNTKAYKISYV